MNGLQFVLAHTTNVCMYLPLCYYTLYKAYMEYIK